MSDARMSDAIVPTLLETNIAWLHQGACLLETLSDADFAALPAAGQSRVGAHFRHVLEFLEQFLGSFPTGRIDYDARPRDLQTELSRLFALGRLQDFAHQLQSLRPSLADAPLLIRLEGSAPDAPHPWLSSTIARELQVLSSHTVHHYALIALILRWHGIAVPPDFGVSPATLRHRSQAA